MAVASVGGGEASLPIVIVALDRPDDLDTAGAGLLAQRQVRPDPNRAFLRQDGVGSAPTGHRQTRPPPVPRSIEVFRRHVPRRGLLAAPHDRDVAENGIRGQPLVFETLDGGTGSYFGVDPEPGAYCLAAREAMRAANGPFADRVAPAAACGPMPRAAPRAAGRLPPAGQSLGLRPATRGLAPHPCRARGSVGGDPPRRPPCAPPAPAASPAAAPARGRTGGGAGRDGGAIPPGVRSGAAEHHGPLRAPCRREGEPFSPAMFSERGFAGLRRDAGTEVAFDPLAEATISATAADALRIGAEFRANRLEATIADTEAAMTVADRPVTAEHVPMRWNPPLARPTAPRVQMEWHAGRTTLRACRRSMVRMHEFRRQTGP